MEEITDFKNLVKSVSKAKEEMLDALIIRALADIGLTMDEFEKSAFTFDVIHTASSTILAIKLHQLTISSYRMIEEYTYTAEHRMTVTMKIEPLIAYEKGRHLNEPTKSTISNATKARQYR